MTNAQRYPDQLDIAPPISNTIGVVFCLLAAVGYTLANIALRKVSHVDPIWVTAVKAVPTMLGMAPAVVALVRRGVPLVPQRQTFGQLLLGCIVGQLFGNCAFQYSLDIIGLALAVPICLGTMVIGGAVCGRMVLGEPVHLRTASAILILIFAAALLSAGSGDSAQAPNQSGWTLATGVAAVAMSGVSYAYFGTMVRRSLLRGMAVSTTMFVSGTTGTAVLALIAWMRIGLAGMGSTTAEQWIYMLVAGLCNLLAFFLLTVALQVVSVVMVNLLNATQVAMAALAGVVLFGEKITETMVGGIGLTVAGLLVLGKRKRALRAAPSGPNGHDHSRRY